MALTGAKSPCSSSSWSKAASSQTTATTLLWAILGLRGTHHSVVGRNASRGRGRVLFRLGFPIWAAHWAALIMSPGPRSSVLPLLRTNWPVSRACLANPAPRVESSARTSSGAAPWSDALGAALIAPGRGLGDVWMGSLDSLGSCLFNVATEKPRKSSSGHGEYEAHEETELVARRNPCGGRSHSVNDLKLVQGDVEGVVFYLNGLSFVHV